MIAIREGEKTHQNTVMSDRLSAVPAREPSAEENLVLTKRSVQIK